MSTPSASGGSKPPTGPQNAATPQSHSHLNAFSSPAPRSVPSPATNRSQAGKSPFNTSSQNHPTIGSTASGPNKLLDASPGNMGSFDSPAAMGPSPSSVGLSNFGFSDGGFNMALNQSGMSGLNIGSSLGGRVDDAERRRRLEYIVARLRTIHPRLSPEGVEIVGQRLGMDSLIDPPQGPRKDGTRAVTLAGDTIAVEVAFQADFNVSAVEVSAPEASDLVAKHFQSASHVLKHDLTRPTMLPLLRHLDKFSHNLERLAKLDKLNAQLGSQGFNCFEAINGVYNSLKRLFEYEKKAVGALVEEKYSHKEARAEREVMCKKSGRPMMNGRHVVGFSHDYWMQRGKHFPPPSATSGDAANVAQIASEPDPEIENQSVFSLLIECEEFSHELYPPVRISDTWISEAVEKPLLDPTDIFGPTLDWLEPPPTYNSGPMSTDPDAMALDAAASKLPNIRFVAKLNPPLVLPDHVASNILASVGVQQVASPVPYQHLLLNIQLVDQMELLGREKTIEKFRLAESRDSDKTLRKIRHQNLLTMRNMLYARTLEEIPFSHPKQIIEILPHLRQWACLNSLLTQSFLPKPIPASLETAQISTTDITCDASFARLAIRFPLREAVLTNYASAERKTSSISDTLKKIYNENKDSEVPAGLELIIDIGTNGDITLLDHQLSGGSSFDFLKGKYRPEVLGNKNGEEFNMEIRQLLAKDFEIASDLDLWVEWIKSFACLPKTTS